MNYIVLDLEFNQPFDFKAGTGIQTKLNQNCPFEIIQIGAVKLNEQFDILDTFNAFIKPVIYPRIHPYVEKITNLSYEQLKDGMSFSEAYTSFVTFIGGKEDIIFCTWGSDDMKLLFKNILYYHLDTSQICNHFINVQKLASMYLSYESGKTIGLKNAVSELNLNIKEPFHNALNDAIYTAKVFQIVYSKEKDNTEVCQISELSKKKKKIRIHMKALVEYFEKALNRELTVDEKKLIKKAYKFGSNHAFDLPKKKKIIP